MSKATTKDKGFTSSHPKKARKGVSSIIDENAAAVYSTIFEMTAHQAVEDGAVETMEDAICQIALSLESQEFIVSHMKQYKKFATEAYLNGHDLDEFNHWFVDLFMEN